MVSMWLGSLAIAAALVQGPPTGEECRIEYEEVVGSGFAIRSASIQPGGTETFNKTVLKIRNREERQLDARLLPPAGAQRTVTLAMYGATDPPALQYAGNWTLKSVHCPTLYPSATHMWDSPTAGTSGGHSDELAKAVQREFQLDPLAMAVLVRPQYQDVASQGVQSGALGTLMAVFPDYAWTANSAASLLRQAQYPGAAAIHGLLRNGLVSGNGVLQIAEAMSGSHMAGYSVTEVLAGAVATIETMPSWNASEYDPAWLHAPAQASMLLRAGFAYGDVATALRDYRGMDVGAFTNTFFYYSREVRGSEADGETARALKDVFGASDVEIASALLRRRKAAYSPGQGVALPPIEPAEVVWAGTRLELSAGLYASKLQRCHSTGRAWVAELERLLQSPDAADLVLMSDEFAGDPAGRAHCLLEGDVPLGQVIDFATTHSNPHEFAGGFEAFGVECPVLVDVLASNGLDMPATFRWLRDTYADLEACIRRVGEVFDTFPFDLYVDALGTGRAAQIARGRGWPFQQVADSTRWFRAPTEQLGPIVRAYRVPADEVLSYLRLFARGQGRHDVFDYARYLLEAFSPKEFCPLLAGTPRGPALQQTSHCRGQGGAR